jgi:hypothetical protein
VAACLSGVAGACARVRGFFALGTGAAQTLEHGVERARGRARDVLRRLPEELAEDRMRRGGRGFGGGHCPRRGRAAREKVRTERGGRARRSVTTVPASSATDFDSTGAAKVCTGGTLAAGASAESAIVPVSFDADSPGTEKRNALSDSAAGGLTGGIVRRRGRVKSDCLPR